ncbi:hypothetical protein FNJ87_02505, partial [Nonlabens mediterrranea]|nr:hypothetical protein [Nonlabens mediterrranea]
MKRAALLFFLPLFALAQTYQYDWAERGGTSSDVITGTPSRDHDHEHILDIAVDANNNYYYLALSMSGSETIGSQTYTSYGTNMGQDLLLFSTDCSGNFRWSKTFGGGMDVYGGGVEVDALGGVYVSGIVLLRNNLSDMAMQFDTDFAYNPNLTSSTAGPHNQTLFITKYDTQGVFQWLQLPQQDNLAANESTSRNYGLVVEDNGTITLQTLFIAGTHFNRNIIVPSPFKGLVIQMNKDGNYLNHFDYDISGEITMDRNVTYHYDPLNGQHYFGIHERIGGGQPVTFNNIQQTGAILIVALDALGNELWRHDSTASGNIKSITTDDQSNVYISGSATNTLGSGNDGFAGYTLTQVTSPTISGGANANYVIKLNASGALQWGTNPTYTTGIIAAGYGLVVNGNEVAMAGAMLNNNIWGNATFNRAASGSAQEPVVVRMDKNTGIVSAIEDIEGPLGFDDEATAIAVDNFGNYVVGGYFTNSIFLNDPNVSSITNSGGDSDFWFARLAKTDCNGVPLSNNEVQNDSFKIYPNPASRIRIN